MYKELLESHRNLLCCDGFEAEGFDWWKYILRALVVSEGNDSLPAHHCQTPINLD